MALSYLMLRFQPVKVSHLLYLIILLNISSIDDQCGDVGWTECCYRRDVVAAANRATIFNSLVVRVATFATNAGVVDVIPLSVLSACHAFDLVIRQRRINEMMTTTRSSRLGLPITSFH